MRRPSALTRVLARLRKRSRGWIRRRQGDDGERVTLTARRIYILPTNLGLGFGGLLFLMMAGAMNYANNLALALAFLLGSLALVAMQHAHRTLSGLHVACRAVDGVFAGQPARFRIALDNEARQPRPELVLTADAAGDGPALSSSPVRLEPVGQTGAQQQVTLSLPTARRGRLRLDRFEIATRHPFGLFRAWSVLHMPLECVVYPKPAPRGLPPPPMPSDAGGAAEGGRGDEEYAGVRPFHLGDPPRRIAWKAYARGLPLQTRVYAGTAVISHLLSFSSLEGLGTEARLAQLTRWVLDAHAAGRAYGLDLPGQRIGLNVGDAQRHRCLTALALFAESAPAATEPTHG